MKPIPLFKVHIPPEADLAVLETLRSGHITQGPMVETFEQQLGRILKNPKILALNSCTSAIQLALHLSGVGVGDEVITTPMTCAATNMPILAAGAKPIWADVDPATGLINPDSVEERVTGKSQAIICVDWGGQPCDLEPLRWIADKHNLWLIEDAAHALGATYIEKPVGNGEWADFTCFSFQAIKHITTMDGGLLACKEDETYKRGKLLRWYGIDRETPSSDNRIDIDPQEWGYKFHMNDVAASLGIAQLPHLHQILQKHQYNHDWLRAHLPKGVSVLHQVSDRVSADWLCTVLLPNSNLRQEFKGFMVVRGVEVSQVHIRNDRLTAFRAFQDDYPLLGVDKFSERMICLPVHWALTKGDLEYVAKTVEEFVVAVGMSSPQPA